MRKNWIAGVGAAALFVAGCATEREQVREQDETVDVIGTSPEVGTHEDERVAQRPEASRGDAQQGVEGPVKAPPVVGTAANVGAAISGTLERVSEDLVVIRDPSGNLYRLQVDERSYGLTEGAQEVRISDLREGAPVRASFVMMPDATKFLREIEVLPEKTWQNEQQGQGGEIGEGLQTGEGQQSPQ